MVWTYDTRLVAEKDCQEWAEDFNVAVAAVEREGVLVDAWDELEEIDARLMDETLDQATYQMLAARRDLLGSLVDAIEFGG
ncbi:MAG: hypothetical protein BGO39_05140 [Chloroflexi bacterium 54-19]|nr:MAG: hypothetical protein BGO39_05140 [Chloroflexi bacterium 54-19]